MIPRSTYRSLCAVLVILGVGVFFFGIMVPFTGVGFLAAGMLLIGVGGAMWPDPAGRGSRIPGLVIAGVGGSMLVGWALQLAPRDGPVLLFGGLLLLPLGVGLLLGELRRYVPQAS